MIDDPRRYRGGLAMLIECDGAGHGILFCVARDASDHDIILMAGQGGICTVTINESAAMRLGLVAQGSPPPLGEAPYFVNSVEAVACTETGISARERALTMRTLGQAEVEASDLHSPGHVMVQVARNVLREGASLPEHANLLLAAVTRTRFAGWSAILDEAGELAGADYCLDLASRLGLDAYDSTAIKALGRERLSPWLEVVEFSRQRFDD